MRRDEAGGERNRQGHLLLLLLTAAVDAPAVSDTSFAKGSKTKRNEFRM